MCEQLQGEIMSQIKVTSCTVTECSRLHLSLKINLHYFYSLSSSLSFPLLYRTLKTCICNYEIIWLHNTS